MDEARSAREDSRRVAFDRISDRRYSVSMVLALLAVVPLVGLGSFTIAQLRESRELYRGADQIESSTQRLNALTELRASLVEEQIWSSYQTGAEQFGLPLGIVTKIVGTDPEAELARVSVAVDELVLDLELDDIDRALEELRGSEAPLERILHDYDAIRGRVEAVRVAEHSRLLTLAYQSRHTASLASAVAVFEASSRARQAISLQLASYGIARFEILDDSGSIQDLLLGRNDHAMAIEEIRAAAAPTSEVPAALEAIESSSELTALTSIIDASIAEALEVGATRENVSPVSIAAQLDQLRPLVQVWSASSAQHADLVDLAATELIATATDARAVASDQAQRAILVAMGLSTLIVGTVAIGTLVMIRPLRELERAAEQLRDGRPVVLKPGGPNEVRAASRALGEAALHVDLATRQAHALATGSLDAPALREAAPGALGSSLQVAVKRLASSLSQSEELRRRLAHEAHHDALTGLANRKASMAHLSQSLARVSRSSSTLAVLFIDLDHFKEINDQHGHHAGDATLTTVAQRLNAVVREGDHVGRLGGDEFVVIAELDEDIAGVMRLGERIIEILSEPIAIDTTTVTVGASIGVAFAEDSGLNADEILRDADLAAYNAKARGRGGIELCDNDLREKMVEEADLSVAIRRAIDNDELVVHYQPIVVSATGEIDALEALVRWRRPGQDKLIEPRDFIPVAERSTLIVDIDRWVIHRVAAQLAAWSDTPGLESCRVAINISGRHVASDGFEDHLLDPLREHGVEPHRIVIELMESVVLDDARTVSVKLQRLRDVGVQIAVDDYGVGLASLTRLRTLPVDIIKVDPLFTTRAGRGQHDESLIKLIIDTGHLAGAQVIAKGVETKDQAGRLTRLGSDNLQGFLCGRPQSPDDLENTFGTRQRSSA